MSVQVSYKKQIILGIMLLIVLLVVIELVVNVWLYNFYRCEFEDAGIFKDVDPETKRKLCLENIGLKYTGRIDQAKGTTGLPQDLDKTLLYINSLGFRSPEFTELKPDNIIRIFAIGGSTTFGSGVLDNQTYPYYLQKIYDEKNLDFEVEIINVGWPGMWSHTEADLIKKQLVNFEPDLFIVFDGFNDLVHQIAGNSAASPSLWKERWAEICGMGEQYGYATFITIQPTVGTGKKILTEQEMESYLEFRGVAKDIQKHGIEAFLKPYPLYLEKLDELENKCDLTADLSGIYDHIQGTIYFDSEHIIPKGNQILAEKLYKLSLPLVIEQSKHVVSDNDFQKAINIENDSGMISNDFEVFYEDFYVSLQQLISPYKTPKIVPLIFNSLTLEEFGVSIGQPEITDSLVSWTSMDQHLNDYQGNDNTGLVNKGVEVYENSPLNYSGIFGSDANTKIVRLQLARESDFDRDRNQDFSGSAWINVPVSDDGIIMHKRNGVAEGWEFKTNSRQEIAFVIEGANGNSKTWFSGALNFTLGEWTLVTFTWDGVNQRPKLYINGEEYTAFASGTLDDSILNDVPLGIGSRSGGSLNLEALIQEVKFYNSELTAKQILEEYGRLN